jgi:hypothetical protein
VTEALRRVLTSGAAGYSKWLMLASFLVTVVPFYHGGNRHLDATYVTSERAAKPYALMIDFVFLFLEAILLFALAVQIDTLQVFYTLLVALFLLDIAWIGFTYIAGLDPNLSGPGYAKWVVMNLIAGAAIALFAWSNLFGNVWATDIAKDIALATVAVGRTIFDYILEWEFYYPPEGRTPAAK